MKTGKIINLIEMRECITSFIKNDRRDPYLRTRTIWYEWNINKNCIQALDSDEQKESQLENYSKMGYAIVSNKQELFGKLKINKIILRKDPNYMSDYCLHSEYSNAFALCFGYLKAKYEHIIIEVPAA